MLVLSVPHPLEAEYLMLVEPAVSAVTTPLPEIVATAVSELLHEPPVAISVRVVVLPGHIPYNPLMVLTNGAAFTVTDCVA
jgi:hypothetical protein